MLHSSQSGNPLFQALLVLNCEKSSNLQNDWELMYMKVAKKEFAPLHFVDIMGLCVLQDGELQFCKLGLTPS